MPGRTSLPAAHQGIYHTMVVLRNLSYLRFLAVSIVLHGIFFLAASSLQLRKGSAPATIPVSILAPSEKDAAPALRAPRIPPARSGNVPATVAKKDSPKPRTKADPAQSKQHAKTEASDHSEAPPAPLKQLPTPGEVLPERTVIAERPLPTVKDLLPPVNWSSRSSNSGPVNLNTSDPTYVSYFTKIKQLIEANWEYPELALRYGLEGKLSLEFTIGSNGQLERARVVRSSGSQLLDDEALRAIKAAAPFPPIPTWVKPNPLSILAAMEYHDNRIHYQSAR
jgi:protein TonB